MASQAKQIGLLGIEKIWKTTRGAGVRVAVLDTGVSTSAALPTSRVEALAADGGDPAPTADLHGTFCASLIGSEKRDAEGVAPEASILTVQVTTDSETLSAAVAVVLLVEARLVSLGAGRDLDRGARPFAAADINRFIGEPLALVADAVAVSKIWQNLQSRLEGNLSEDARRDVLADAVAESADRITRIVESVDRLAHGTADPRITNAMTRARAFLAVAASLMKRDYGSATVGAFAQLKEMGAGSSVTTASKYLPLIVEIASAQSSNDVAAAFDAYAAPIGTYKLKYKRPMITINGFLGAHAGVERLDSEGVKGTNTVIGGFAPVGVHTSLPICDGLHIGALLSVLHLGAVTTIKTDTDDQPEAKLEGAAPTAKAKASEAPKIGFAQVCSPGAYLVLGIAGSPFVIGAGASLSPELREVTQDGLKTDVSALRVGAFLAVDVPILPLQ